jgi:uncharacterized protein YqfB (UPF0267 family)
VASHGFGHHMFILVCDNMVTIYQTWLDIKHKACTLTRDFTLEEFIEHLNNVITIKNINGDKAKVSFIKLTNGFANKGVIREVVVNILGDILSFGKVTLERISDNKTELEEGKSDKAKNLINKIYNKIIEHYRINEDTNIKIDPTDDEINYFATHIKVSDIDWKLDNSKIEVFVYGNEYHTIDWDRIRGKA